jgi:hypothetical protein
MPSSLTFAFGDIGFALDERADTSLWSWATEKARAIPQAPRAQRRLASLSCRRQLKALMAKREPELSILVRRHLPADEMVDRRWVPDEFDLPRQPPRHIDKQLVERGLIAGIVFASLRLANKFGHFGPLSLLGPVAPERKWRIVINKQKARPAEKPPQRPAAARLLIALLRFVLGFFGSHKVDARNTP